MKKKLINHPEKKIIMKDNYCYIHRINSNTGQYLSKTN